MTSDHVQVLCGLRLLTSASGAASSLNDSRKALLVALALSPDGLTNEQAWLAREGSEYGGPTKSSQDNLLSKERGRIAESTGLCVQYVRRSGRAFLGEDDEIGVDARRFEAACEEARTATETDRLSAWKLAIEAWPRIAPLCEIHPYVQDTTLFESLEINYRKAVIEFGILVAEDPGRQSDDVSIATESATNLLTELEAAITECTNRKLRPGDAIPDKFADARELRHVLAKLSHLQPMPTINSATEAYLEHYRSSCEFVYPQRLPRDQRSQDIVVQLNDVYVSLALGPSGSEEITADHELSGGKEDSELEFTSDPNLRRLDELVATRRWSVILGDPGSGKTTLLQWLALQHAKAILGGGQDRVIVDPTHLGLPEGPKIDLGPARLPILVSLAEYAETAIVLDAVEDEVPAGSEASSAADQPGARFQLGPLRDFLAHHKVLQQSHPLDEDSIEHVLEDWLGVHRVLVLLDGMDEVRDVRIVELVAQRVMEFCREFIPDPQRDSAFSPGGFLNDVDSLSRPGWSEPRSSGGSQIVVTSRLGGYARSPLRDPFTVLKACDLAPDDIDRFARNWCFAVEAWQARAAAQDTGPLPDSAIEERASSASDELLAAIHQHPSLKRVASNPLMLTVLALLQREHGTILPTRFAILEQLITVLVTRRSREWTYAQVIDVLGPLALWMQANGLRHAHRDDVERELGIALRQRVVESNVERHIDLFLAAAKDQSGLLVETSPNYFGFFEHNVFRELLAAIELTRDPSAFPTWITSHLDDPHWAEVLLLGVAAIGDKHPLSVDPVLCAILEAPDDGVSSMKAIPPSPGEVVHGRATLSAAALLEMDRGSPQTIERIVNALVETGSTRRGTVLSERHEVALAQLIDSDVRRRQVEPLVASFLSSDLFTPFLCDSLARSNTTCLDLLVALDAVCQNPFHPRSAPNLRASMARTLRSEGAQLDPNFAPLGDLLPELTHLPAVETFVEQSSTWIDPPLYRFLSYLSKQKSFTESDVIDRLFQLLTEEVGDGFDSLARLGRAIDEERVHSWIEEQTEAEGVELVSATRYLMTFPPKTVDLADSEESTIPLLLCEWNASTPSAIRTVLQIAWRALEPGSPYFGVAWDRLALHSNQFGWLPATCDALERIRDLLSVPALKDYGEALLAKLRLSAEIPSEVAELLLEILEDEDDPLRPGAAVLRAGRLEFALTVEQVDLIAGVLAAHDDPLRSSAMAALGIARPAAQVSDELLERFAAHKAERRAAGDAAAAFAWGCISSHMFHANGERILGWTENGEEPDWAVGRIKAADVDDAIAELAGHDNIAGETSVLHACLRGVEGMAGPTELDLERIECICNATDSHELKDAAAELFVVNATQTGRAMEIVDFVTELAIDDPDAAANAIRAAGWGLLNRSDKSAASRLADLADTLSSTTSKPAMAAGARLVVDASRIDDVDEVVELLEARTASLAQAARSILYAVSGAENWSGNYGLDRQIKAVTELFAKSAHGIRTLLAVCAEPLASSDAEQWPERRGAVHLLDTVAQRAPGLFIKHSPKTLKESLIKSCRDDQSFSVRRTAFALIARYPTLDDETIDAIRAATRDDLTVSLGLNWQLRWRSGPDPVQEEFISAITPLLSERNERTVLSAAVLLCELAKKSQKDAAGHELRTIARSAVAARIFADDPILDIGNGRGVLSLRNSLILLLLESNSDSISPSPALRTRRHVDEVFEAGVTAEDSLLDAVRKSARIPGIDPQIKLFTQGNLSVEQSELLNLASCIVLETRVGDRLAKRMRNEFLAEFELVMNNGSERDALQVIQAAQPDYQEVVRLERDRVVAEFRKNAKEILSLIRSLRADTVLLEGEQTVA